MAKLLFLSLFLFSFHHTLSQRLPDEQATRETQSLYRFLQRSSGNGIMFGHQEDLAYGVGWMAKEGRSDVKDVCGDYPAIHGWDISKEGSESNIDHVSFSNIRKWIIEVYERGGVNTVSWHVDNPSSNGNAWDTTQNPVKNILPGGKDHESFRRRLDNIAIFLRSCQSEKTPVPIIFRPFHEHNGNWFWWGKGHCSEQDFVRLWKYTADYLRRKKNLHHLIFAFSPDRSRLDLNDLPGSYLYGYPGDEYVDLLGIDDYMDVGISWNQKSKEEQRADFVTVMKSVTDLAKKKGKVAACTETGLEGVVDRNWFTEVVLKPLKSNAGIQLSYLMVWRNANEKHHYAPYPGHASENDFKEFYRDGYTLFESDLKNVYDR